MDEAIRNWIINLYCATHEYLGIGSLMLQVLGEDSQATTALEGAVTTAMTEAIPAMESVGLAIAVLFFLINLVDLATTDRFTLEYFIKFITKLVVGVFLVANTDILTKTCMEFGNGLQTIISDAFGTTGSKWAESQAEYRNAITNTIMNDETPWIGLLIETIFSCALMNILGLALYLITYVICFSRLLEMAIRATFMPIALGLMSDDGWKGASGRYIKKFLSLCCQGGVLVALACVSDGAMTALATADTSMSTLIVQAGVALATVAMMFKSIGFINDAFGV